tara:strand:- start:68 stop:619 length:552 start_codon:yes stop_codon:yes gene_type:complete
MAITRDYTGHPCSHCGVTLDENTHSNRSKLSSTVNRKTRAWRICRACISKNKKKTRDYEQARAYSRKFAYQKWENTLANQCRRRARDYALKCEITPEIIKEMYQRQNGKCFWLKIPLIPSKQKKALNQPSVDRLDPSGDYTIDNCVLCCFFANIGRRNTDRETWERSVKKLLTATRRKYVQTK